MKVLMLGFELAPAISGGLGTACAGIARALGESGVDVVFVTPHGGTSPQAAVEVLAADDVPLPEEDPTPPAPGPRRARPVRHVRVPSALSPYMDEREYRRKLEVLRHEAFDVPPEERLFSPVEKARTYGDDLPSEVRRYARAVGELAGGIDFDVIHAHDWMSFPAGVAAREASGKPLVCHVHSCEHDRRPRVHPEDPGPDKGILAVESAGLAAADRVVCVSRRAADELVLRHDCPNAKLRVVHNAVEPPAERTAAAPHPAGHTVLFLGRLTHQKGPEFFLEAARRVRVDDPDVRFVVCGTGELLPRMIERTRELELDDHVEFKGFLEGADRERVFADADVYVMPSVSEPFGITPLEAMVRGVPVIVSKQAGVREVTKSVLEVDYWDVEGLAERILAVLHRPALRQQLAEQGRLEAERLRWERPARRLVGIYEEVIA